MPQYLPSLIFPVSLAEKQRLEYTESLIKYINPTDFLYKISTPLLQFAIFMVYLMQ